MHPKKKKNSVTLNVDGQKSRGIVEVLTIAT